MISIEEILPKAKYQTIPSQYKSHPLIEGRSYYTLPLQLLKELVKHCGENAFDAVLLKMERDLATALRHNPRLIGFDGYGEVLSHDYLSKDDLPLPNPDDQFLNRIGKTRAGYDQFLDEAKQLLTSRRNELRGYIGWLVTNPSFRNERDQLFQKWERHIAVVGIPQHGTMFLRNASGSHLVLKTRKPRRSQFFDDFTGFYRRWRLRHLMTHELPVPVAPKVTARGALEGNALMNGGGVCVWQPDTVPVSSGDQLKVMLDDMRLSGDNDHLDEWINKFSKTGTNSHTIHKFGDVLTVHFYRNLLQERHPNMFNRRKGKVIAAFGEYLGLSPRPIQRIIRLIDT